MFKYKIVSEPVLDFYGPEKVTQSNHAADFARKHWDHSLSIYESFYIIMMNRVNKIIGFPLISQGGVSGTVVDSKLIGIYAVKALASNIILVHNHPSGSVTPSKADIRITNKVKQGLEFLDIKVLDHIILTPDAYYSFSDEGIL